MDRLRKGNRITEGTSRKSSVHMICEPSYKFISCWPEMGGKRLMTANRLVHRGSLDQDTFGGAKYPK